MAVHFRCSSCSCVLTIAERQARDEITCPLCHFTQLVPPSAGPKGDEGADLPPAMAAEQEPTSAAVLCVQPLDSVGANDAVAEEEAAAAPGRHLQEYWPLAAPCIAVILVVGSLIVPSQPAVTTSASAKKADGRVPPVQKQPAPRPDGLAIAKSGKGTRPPGQARPQWSGRELAAAVPRPWHSATEAELYSALLNTPEVSVDLDQFSREKLLEAVQQAEKAQEAQGGQPFPGPFLLPSQQAVLKGLPLILGHDSQLSPQQAAAFVVSVAKLRDALSEATGLINLDGPIDAALLRSRCRKFVYAEGGLRACLQMLQPRKLPARELLIEVLEKTAGPAASQGLARLAVTDLSPLIRRRACLALRKRPAQEYQEVLVRYLNYPWAPVAEHAAETLIELDAQAALPSLVRLLREPDVTVPRPLIEDGETRHAIPELVRINHLKNCVLCHAPFRNAGINHAGIIHTADFVAAVPDPRVSLSSTFGLGYASQDNLAVRIDVTYLRQDFSVVQPVAHPRLWPAKQRFDFVVRLTPVPDPLVGILTRKAQRRGASPQREALLYTLRRLTGRNPGRTFADWQPLLPSAVKGAG